MRGGSIAAEATAVLGHTSKGKSGGVNGRGYPSLAFRRHQRRASHEPLVQHHERGKGALGCSSRYRVPCRDSNLVEHVALGHHLYLGAVFTQKHDDEADILILSATIQDVTFDTTAIGARVLVHGEELLSGRSGDDARHRVRHRRLLLSPL